MKARYQDARTLYVCRRCGTAIGVESDAFYEFCGEDDPKFWCATCQDFPSASLIGQSAASLPSELRLRDRFTLRIVPTPATGNIQTSDALYKPYSKRSFLRQYLDWLLMRGSAIRCQLRSSTSLTGQFDLASQSYTSDADCQIQDFCDSSPCHFLSHTKLKPEKMTCDVLDVLCDSKSEQGLCDTGDEALILRHYIQFTGAEHFPMLIPQPALFTGRRRPDFLAFIPVSRFQYRQIVVLVDRPGKPEANMKAETDDYERHGFKVKRLAVGGQESHFKLARDLKNWFEEGAY